MLLKPTMFTGNLDLGQTIGDYVTENIESAIQAWEGVYYTAMLGEPLYNELLEAGDVSVMTPEQRIIYEMTLPAALRFVYTHYVQDNRVVVSGMTVTVPEAAEARTVSPFDIQRERWNEGVAINIRFIHYMRSDSAVPVDWQPDEWAIRMQHLTTRMSQLGVWER